MTPSPKKKTRAPINWALADPTKTPTEIAAALGCTRQAASAWLNKRGGATDRPRRFDPSKVDWTRDINDIATDNGVTVSAVRYHHRKLFPELNNAEVGEARYFRLSLAADRGLEEYAKRLGLKLSVAAGFLIISGLKAESQKAKKAK